MAADHQGETAAAAATVVERLAEESTAAVTREEAAQRVETEPRGVAPRVRAGLAD